MSGYMDDSHHFVGRLHLNGTLYHVEPASRYFTLPHFDSVMFKSDSTLNVGKGQLLQTVDTPLSEFCYNVFK